MSKTSHTVEKIGGTSMSQFDKILKNIFLKPDLYNRIFVLSAYNGITDMLLENKKNGKPGIYQKFANNLDSWVITLKETKEKMIAINETLAPLGLDKNHANNFITERLDSIKTCLDDLTRICSYGHFDLPQYLPAMREMLSAVGEAHSTFNTTEILKNKKINATFIDLTGHKNSANLPFHQTICNAFKNIDFTRELPIVTGHTKCKEGLMNTFDRGYSEITFSKICNITNAREGIIHKEFHLSSGDPKLIGEKKVRPLEITNFDVADQLADLGMEAIHPKASKMLEQKKIPLRVKNAFFPDHPGTIFKSNDYRSEKLNVEIITGNRNIISIEIWDPDMIGAIGYDLKILTCFKKFGISYIGKNTNANTITHYIKKRSKNIDKCLKELKNLFPSATISTLLVAVVSCIGSNIHYPGFLARATTALSNAEINILACNQCLRQVNMQFIVNVKHYEKAIKTLHKNLIEESA